MVRTLLAVGLYLVLAVAVGCSDGSEPSSEPTATTVAATATAALDPGPTPPPVTGIPPVDAAIDALQGADIDALLTQLRVSPFSCTVARLSKLGVWTCSGDADVVAMEAFPSEICGHAYWSLELAQLVFLQILSSKDRSGTLYAVYETRETGFDTGFFSPSGASHVVILRRPSAELELRSGFLIGDEGIVGYAEACGESAEDFIGFWELSDALLTVPVSEPTGITSVDAAIDAIERQDADALAELVRLVPVQCTVAPFDYPRPACGGEPDGTMLDRFPVSDCEREYVPRDVAVQTVRDLLADVAVEVAAYAVYEAGSGASGLVYDTYERPRYALVVETTSLESTTGSALLLNNGGIIGYTGACGSSPREYILNAGLYNPIIPQPTPTALPDAPVTGIGSVDAAVDAIQRNDSEALRAQIRMPMRLCEPDPPQLPAFHLCDSESVGELVEAFPLTHCEGAYVDRAFAERNIHADGDVYAVLAAPASWSTTDFFSNTDPRYVVVVRMLGGPDIVHGSGLVLNGEGIAGLIGACLRTPEAFVADFEDVDAIIPPPDER